MSLKQYSRDFLLSRRCHPIVDLVALANIDPNLDILTRSGSKSVRKMTRSKKKSSLQPKLKMSKSNPLMNAVDMYLNPTGIVEQNLGHSSTDNFYQSQVAGAIATPSCSNQSHIPFFQMKDSR